MLFGVRCRLTMPEAVLTSGRVRNMKVCGHVNRFQKEDLKLEWVTAHAGINGNDTADYNLQ